MPTPHLPPHLPPEVPLRQLRRVRWAVRGTLVLGVAASVAANVLHARPDPVAQLIAAWPPLALLLTVELISRVPVHRRLLAAARLAATTAIAGIATWVSYWHMAGVASRYGEQGASPFLLPLSVDGLVIVASVSLVELAGRIRAADAAHVPPAPSLDAAHGGRANGTHPTLLVGTHPGPGTTTPTRAEPAAEAAGHAPAASTPGAIPGPVPGRSAGNATPAGGTAPVGRAGRVDAGGVKNPDSAPAAEPGDNRGPGAVEDPPRVPAAAAPVTARPERPPAEPRAAIAYWHAKDPTLKPGDIAARVGRSRSTVRRILAELADRAANPATNRATDHDDAAVDGSAR